MDASEAMRVLHGAGRGDEADRVLETALRAAQSLYSAIEADETRTDDFKRAEARRVYDQARESLRVKLESAAASVRQRLNEDTARAFGTVGIRGDEATLAISRRDAVDRVKDLTTREDRQRVLADATATGDEVLARAVASKAMDVGDSETLNIFTADRPELETAVEKIWADRHLAGRDKMRFTMALYELRPTRLGA